MQVDKGPNMSWGEGTEKVHGQLIDFLKKKNLCSSDTIA